MSSLFYHVSVAIGCIMALRVGPLIYDACDSSSIDLWIFLIGFLGNTLIGKIDIVLNEPTEKPLLWCTLSIEHGQSSRLSCPALHKSL